MALTGRRGSGVVQCSQRPVLAKFYEGSMDPPPQLFYSPLSPWVVLGVIVDRHFEPFTEVMGSLCGELRAWVAA